MNKEKLSPLDALERLERFDGLENRNPIAYVLEKENLGTYYKIIREALKDYELLDSELNESEEEIEILTTDLEEAEHKLKLFNILNDKDVDVWLIKHCDYENYCRIRTLCLEATGNADLCCDCDKEIINLPTEKEFNELKEVLL